MSKDLKLKVLQVIEGLTILYEDGKKSHKDAEQMLGDIYKYSHIATRTCKNKHKDWFKELDKTYEALKKDYI